MKMTCWSCRKPVTKAEQQRVLARWPNLDGFCEACSEEWDEAIPGDDA